MTKSVELFNTLIEDLVKSFKEDNHNVEVISKTENSVVFGYRNSYINAECTYSLTLDGGVVTMLEGDFKYTTSITLTEDREFNCNVCRPIYLL